MVHRQSFVTYRLTPVGHFTRKIKIWLIYYSLLEVSVHLFDNLLQLVYFCQLIQMRQIDLRYLTQGLNWNKEILVLD